MNNMTTNSNDEDLLEDLEDDEMLDAVLYETLYSYE